MNQLQCSACGRTVAAGHRYRNGYTCGVAYVTQRARLARRGRGVVWHPQITDRCLGTLLSKRYRKAS